MRIYTVHMREFGVDSDKDFQLVQEGFSKAAFFFGPAWALWQGLWKEALMIFAAGLLLSFAAVMVGLNEDGQLIVWLAFSVIIGFIADDLKRCALSRQGMGSMAVISGKNEDDAARRFLDQHPEFARELLR